MTNMKIEDWAGHKMMLFIQKYSLQERRFIYSIIKIGSNTKTNEYMKAPDHGTDSFEKNVVPSLPLSLLLETPACVSSIGE